ncbi:hypothetical protein RchiOBHm_Chr6g0274831 [Rosa chinensis]|uniref:Uncharacterized protein n=2 Tax=Rosa chinensis TaxID=74649 RepID=A0A2P6PRU9_ROSCH|nr:uncharacterized protein LOC121049699 isoform X1 [Rosa chinensis]XP_040363585.1 uncharacterized protein LOC121049699 isoform X1 [Rosa chinensis]PRQ24657.1 hypothetical protein RchiOBHm_Chr6g0274831 [Rosa chinensis]
MKTLYTPSSLSSHSLSNFTSSTLPAPSSLVIGLMEMDFYAMKRKQLQRLCKKHSIPANIGNAEMANRLTLLHKVQIQKAKKVSFNPENEIFFFVATPKYSYSSLKKKRVQKRKSRVKQASKKQVQLAENGRELELSVSIIVTPVRHIRSRAQRMQQGDAEAMCLPFSAQKKVRSIEENVGGDKPPPKVKLSEGVGGDTKDSISSGVLIYKKLRSRIVVCKYGGDSMVSKKKINAESAVEAIVPKGGRLLF